MSHINTLTGPLAGQDLGFTLMHEHLFVLNWSMRQAFPDWLDRRAIVEQAVADLHAAYASGVRTIVDCTAINLGRDIDLAREIAERSPVHIIASTGLYWTEEPWLDRWEPDLILDWLKKDVGGMQGSGIKPGVIKCGSDRFGVTPLNRKLLQVTARLHHKTGLPITTHTTKDNDSALQQLDIFAEEGVDLSHVVIGHCGDSADIGKAEAILARGSFIGMDRFRAVRQVFGFNTENRVKLVAELCQRGYASRMVFSHDEDVASDFGQHKRPVQAAAPAPTGAYCYVADTVVPALRAAGVTDEQIRQMTVENPRRVFER